MDFKFAKDNELVLRVKERACNESLKELIARHTPLCYKIYRNYLPLFIRLGKTIENFEVEKDYVIYQAAQNFVPEKAKFVTWVGRCMHYYCLNSLRGDYKTSTYDFETMKFLMDKVSLHHSTVDIDLQDYIMEILSNFRDKRIKTIYQMRYFDNPKKNTPWKIIAQKLDISIQTAINLHESAQKLLKEKLTSKQIIDII